MRETFVFYRSIYESAMHLPKLERGEFLECVIEYSLNGELKELPEGVVRAMFEGTKINIDRQLTNYKNGAKPKRTRSKTEATLKPKANYKEKEKEKDKEKEGIKTPKPLFKNYMDVLEWLQTNGKDNLDISVSFENIIVKVSEYGKAYEAESLKDLDRNQETRFLTYLMNNTKEL